MTATQKKKREVDALTGRPAGRPRIEWLSELAFHARYNRVAFRDGKTPFPVAAPGALRALVALLRTEGYAPWQLLTVLEPLRHLRTEVRGYKWHIASKKRDARERAALGKEFFP